MLHDELALYRTHHLFLLIGANPLPNYIAARLLASQNGHVYLLHSHGTAAVADRLQTALGQVRPDLQIAPHETDEVDAALIQNAVEFLAEQSFAARQTVGLSYTGGTKPMALHVARVLKEYGDPVLSYLDPRQLELVIEPRDATQPQKIRVGKEIQLTFRELVELHGYKLENKKGERVEIRQTPKEKILALANVLHTLYQTSEGLKEWYNYSKKLSASKEPEEATPHETSVREFVLPNGDGLRDVRHVMVQMTGMDAPTPNDVARALGEFSEYKSYEKIFRGEWLEEYTLHALAIATRQLNFSEYGIGLKPLKKIKLSSGKEFRLEMELDVAALHGYQLFAISCQATDRLEYAKDHFLELVVRAQQLGGDEARFGLVCFLDTEAAEKLRNEIQEEFGAPNRVRVFGLRGQINLARALQEWIRDASNPKPKTP